MKVDTTLVATGRNWVGFDVRAFRNVINEMIIGSKKHLAMTIYLITDQRIALMLEKALEKGVKVEIFCCKDKDEDNHDVMESIKKMQDRFPYLSIIEVDDGVLHAKVLISDLHEVLVGSANLTRSAMSSNYELGFFVKDGAMAQKVIKLLRSLDENVPP